MGDLTISAKNELLDHIFNAAYTPASNMYLCLCTADPTESATTGSTINEYGDQHGYARTQITFGAASSRKVDQSADVNFPMATADWTSQITHWAICDSATHNGGNCLAFGAFTSGFQPVTNNTPKISSGQCEIEIAATAAGAGFTDWCVHKMLDLMFRNQAWSAPDTYIAVALAVISDSTLESGMTEEDGSGYHREQVNPNSGSAPKWDLAASKIVDNAGTITIGPPSASDWDEMTSLALVDAATGGNLLAYDNTIADQTPVNGDTIEIAAGDASFTLT